MNDIRIAKMREGAPRVCLVQPRTPVVHLPRLSASLGGPEIYLKRDDLTGLALGGNKLRKLEFLLGDAKRVRADVVITAGGAQSNHAAQTAAAAAATGLSCVLVLQRDSGNIPETAGNLLLGQLHGARMHWTDEEPPFERTLESVADALRESGHRPYIIPFGGSNSIGALGYVDAMTEYRHQVASGDAPDVEHHIVATGSGGTQAGLIVGSVAGQFQANIIGVSVLFAADVLIARIQSILGEMLDRGDLDRARAEIDVRDDFLGEGYGVVAEAEAEAIQLVARTEGILLDPTYTGRAMAGLIAMIRARQFRPDQKVLFWHTGGQAALFGKQHALLPFIS